eukprot:364809-Chlamydomonas_euryale.AAC.12
MALRRPLQACGRPSICKVAGESCPLKEAYMYTCTYACSAEACGHGCRCACMHMRRERAIQQLRRAQTPDMNEPSSRSGVHAQAARTHRTAGRAQIQ